jgi:hypothetical protein
MGGTNRQTLELHTRKEGNQMPDNVIRVERGERLVLAPDSPRFSGNYQQVQPETASQLRELVGVSIETERARADNRLVRRRPSPLPAVAVNDLRAADTAVRSRAQLNAGLALRDYVYAMNSAVASDLDPLFAAYLTQWQVKVRVAVLPDIHVADGATLVISEDTHVVRANNIVINGSGKIECFGSTKFEAASIVGT